MHLLADPQTWDPFPERAHYDDTADRRQANRAVAVSALGLGLAGLVELAMALFSGSVGLLGDALHNLSDVSTSAVVFVGFRVSKRPATPSNPYGYERAEDIAGLGVAGVIWASAAFAGFVSVHKLVVGGRTTHVGLGIVAAIIGIVANQLVAGYKGRAGRRIQSATLIADARHSRLDALASAGALIGLLGVVAGYAWADGVAGLVVTGFIVHVGWEVTSELVAHLMDAVDPAMLSAAEQAVLARTGVSHVHVRGRWMGRSLLVESGRLRPPDDVSRGSDRTAPRCRGGRAESRARNSRSAVASPSDGGRGVAESAAQRARRSMASFCAMAEIEANGVRLHYEVTGDGPPLVFVHGMCGRGEVWAGQVERLSDEFTCITYDRRGHGSSTDTDAQHTVPLHGDDFAALVTALGLAPVLCVGSSGGARVGVDVVLRHPNMLVGAVLSEPPVFSLDPERGKEFLGRVVPRVQPKLETGDLPGAVDAFFEVVCPGLWALLDASQKEPYRQSGLMLVADLRQPPFEVSPDDLAAVQLPLLAIAGLDSDPFLQSTPRTIARSAPRAELVELPDSGHVTYAEQPDAFADAVRSFARRTWL